MTANEIDCKLLKLGVDSTSIATNFVGRERELAELIAACEAGADSDAHLFLISGEPGIGKTRLADELAARAKTLGMQVLWGRCWEGEGAPAYWPWIQIVRAFLGTLDPEQRSSLVVESEVASEVIHQVAQIIPDLRPAPIAPNPSVSEKLEPSEARFRLFDAVTNFLKMGARSHPMLIVLDDLHDADEASLELLRFMTRDLDEAPISIVATYRELEVRRSPSLSKMIGQLSREARAIPLSGLSEYEVSQLVASRAGRAPEEMLVTKLCDATNGNPLFVDGIVRNLIAEGALGSAGVLDRPFSIPSGIREAIRNRLDALAPESIAILAVAAAIGNEFEFHLCRAAAEIPADDAHRLLDEAASAGLVTALGYGRYRFSHALVRATVYDDLDSNRRIGIHGKIASRIEEIYRQDVDAHLAELAHHFREAGVTEKAAEYSVRAGRAAASVFAFTETIMHWQAALKLMEQHGGSALERADLLHELGRFAFEVDRSTSLRYGESAIALYESLGRLDQAAHVHILMAQIFHMRGDPLANSVLASEHLRRAESAIANGPETFHLAHLFCVTAANESAKLNFVESAKAARRAMGISDRLGDKGTWQWAAVCYGWSLCMEGRLSEGFAHFERAFEATLQAKISGYSAAWGAGFISKLLGDPRGSQLWFEREQNRKRKEAAPLPFKFFAAWIEMTRFDQGHLSKAEQKDGFRNPGFRFWGDGEWEAVADWLERRVEESERTDNRLLSLDLCVFGGLTNLLIGQNGRAEALFRYGLDNPYPASVVLLEMRARPWLARLYLAMNRVDEAAEQMLRCRQIMTAGEDWRGLVGSVVLAEAIVATGRGNYDVAKRQFESALAIHRKYHLGWCEADTLQYWGRALAAAGDRIGAAEKFDAAIENHRSRGVGSRMIDYVVADKKRALGSTSPSRRQLESKLMGAFRKEGEYWTISYDAATFRLKDAKGLRYIAYLLARPGKRIHVHDLIEAVEGRAANGRTTIDPESEDLEIVRELGGPGPTIDARARSEYRTRLRDLQAELDEAERMNDLGRSQRLHAEIEMVGQELTGSSGLGGRARAASSSAERARVPVGRNVRAVLEKIRHQHPGLGRHFATSISTGYFCAYQPDPEHAISWQF